MMSVTGFGYTPRRQQRDQRCHHDQFTGLEVAMPSIPALTGPVIVR